ncbi:MULTISPECIES: tyrosine-protein phosphatase [unclassified Microbacterium]|uniref:tyrosine-protein phosphatase n=1 Tax=unclassified Microbacterium TaxID=2609290 RepID=UPI0012FA964E|nr:tyrosine-protein phosphatase [Microbacterium sp. MAH-37]MVQ41317.1 protein-tyrosine-phosphatase [Microbacterium sp. MAH-37]
MTTATIDIVLSAPVNLRDLGGIPIDGGVLRKGLAVRADDLSLVTTDAANALLSDGLTAVIDLRSTDEALITGRGPLGARAVSYHHLPLMSDVRGPMREGVALTHESMGEMYVAMVENASGQLVSALNVIAHAPGATAFHCAAGRDRTGVLAAALLLALGASDDDIVVDYARTAPNMPAIMTRTSSVMGPLLASLGMDLERLGGNALAEGDMSVSMRRMLGELRERHGDPLQPLRDAGLSDATIARLRERALAS